MTAELTNVDVDGLNFQAKTHGIEAQLLKISDNSNGSVYVIPKVEDGETKLEVVAEKDMEDIHEHIEY